MDKEEKTCHEYLTITRMILQDMQLLIPLTWVGNTVFIILLASGNLTLKPGF